MLKNLTWGTGIFLCINANTRPQFSSLNMKEITSVGVGEIIYNEGIGKITSIGMGEVISVGIDKTTI
jgi:hypothetical protein